MQIWQRAAKMMRDRQLRRARKNISKRYKRDVAQIESKARTFATMYLDSNRELFNRLVEFYSPTVADRGRYLLRLRNTCEMVVSKLLMQELMQRHTEDLEKIDPVHAELMTHLAINYAIETEAYFATLKRANFPLKPLVTEYMKRLFAQAES